MDFRILGPLEVWEHDRRILLGGPRQERLTAVLLLNANRVVPLSTLIEAVWDAESPATARHQVHKAVGDLRRRLGGRIVTDGPGYRIDCDRLDLLAFDEHLRVAQHAPPTEAAEHLRAALALWRGSALSGLYGGCFEAAARGVQERHSAAMERFLELRIELGGAAEVVGELRTLVTANPLHEGFRARLMLALYRCGRQSDALSAFREGRQLLDDQLGLDPGPELVRLHDRILRGEMATEAEAQRHHLAVRAALPHTLPSDPPDFAGRSAEVARLLYFAGNGTGRVGVIDGMAGIGKTALALHAAHRLGSRYPGGQLLIDLRGHSAGRSPLEPEAALDLLLRMLGVAASDVPGGLEPRAARWRAELAARKVLVVLDDAASASQVRPLLPGTSSSLALITSRRQLGGLEGATSLHLGPLSPAAAADLFVSVAGADRAGADPDALGNVIDRCGRLPLAISIAATRLRLRPQWTVRYLAARLRDAGRRMAELTIDDRSVAAELHLSYERLSQDQKRLFRQLGRHAGLVIDTAVAAAVAGRPVGQTERLLEDLVDAHLLQQPEPECYTFHVLVRQYARTLGDGGDGTCPTEPGGRRDRMVKPGDRQLDPATHLSAAPA